jgi:hypothetical protein
MAFFDEPIPGSSAVKWGQVRVAAGTRGGRDGAREAMRARQARYGQLPSSYDWSRTHARRRGPDVLARLEGDWPAPGTVTDLFGTWARARAEAAR